MKFNAALFPIIAALFGMSGAHNHGTYEGRLSPGSAGLARVLNPSNVPLVGSEKGDRAEVERIFAGTFALPVGQPTIISRELPVGDPWLTMRINLRGQLRDPGVPATGTIVPNSPLVLWDLALSTDADRDVIEPSVSAHALYRYNQFLYGTAGELVAAVLPNTNTTLFNAVVDIPFVDPKLYIPMDTVLDTRRYNAVTLTITTGTIASLIDTPAATSVLESCFADIEIVRISPRVPLPATIAKAVPFFKRHAPIVPPGETFINLDRIPTLAIKRILSYTSNGAAGPTAPRVGVPFTGTGVNTILDTWAINSNYRTHFGSPAGGVSRRTLQGGNKMDYSIEAWPAGWYVADFMLEKSLWNALATGDKSTLETRYVYQGAGANVQQLSVMVAGVQMLRKSEGV